MHLRPHAQHEYLGHEEVLERVLQLACSHMRRSHTCSGHAAVTRWSRGGHAAVMWRPRGGCVAAWLARVGRCEDVTVM